VIRSNRRWRAACLSPKNSDCIYIDDPIRYSHIKARRKKDVVSAADP